MVWNDDELACRDCGESGGELDPDELLRRVAGGDLEAFAQLHSRFAVRVFHLVRSWVHSRVIAEEVTQDVFLWVWLSSHRFDPARGTAAGLIFTVARRRAVDAIRHEESMRRKAAMLGIDPAREPAVDATGAVDDHVLVEHLMTGLTQLERQAVRLTYWEGLSGEELAEALGIKVNTGKTRKHDGLMRMRRIAELEADTAD